MSESPDDMLSLGNIAWERRPSGEQDEFGEPIQKKRKERLSEEKKEDLNLDLDDQKADQEFLECI